MMQQDPYAGIARPVAQSDPYAGIAAPAPAQSYPQRNARRPRAVPSGPALPRADAADEPRRWPSGSTGTVAASALAVVHESALGCCAGALR